MAKAPTRNKPTAKLAVVEERPLLLPVPSDILGEYRERYIEITETVAHQSGLTISDAPVIADVVRSQRRAAIFDAKSTDAFAEGNSGLAMQMASAAERAIASYRSGLASLKALPNDRSAKVSRHTQAQTVASSSNKWSTLLGDDQ